MGESWVSEQILYTSPPHLFNHRPTLPHAPLKHSHKRGRVPGSACRCSYTRTRTRYNTQGVFVRCPPKFLKVTKDSRASACAHLVPVYVPVPVWCVRVTCACHRRSNQTPWPTRIVCGTVCTAPLGRGIRLLNPHSLFNGGKFASQTHSSIQISRERLEILLKLMSAVACSPPSTQASTSPPRAAGHVRRMGEADRRRRARQHVYTAFVYHALSYRQGSMWTTPLVTVKAACGLPL